MLEKPTIYLAGPITGVSDNDRDSWREKIIREYGDVYNFRNPVDRMSPDRTEIALGERDDIFASDAILALVSKPSMGTAMGIMYGWFSHRIVVLWHPDGSAPLSNMTKSHANSIVSTPEEAIDYIHRRLSRSRLTLIYRNGKKEPFNEDLILVELETAISSEDVIVRPHLTKLATAVRMYLEDEVERGILDANELTFGELQDAIEIILEDHAHRGGVASLAGKYKEYRNRLLTETRLKHEDAEISKFIESGLHDMKSNVGNIGRSITRIENELKNQSLSGNTKHLEDIRRNHRAIMDDIIKFKTKVEERNRIEDVNLKSLLEEYEINCEKENHHCIISCEDNLVVKLSRHKLRGILTNLIDNGIQHGFDQGESGEFQIQVEIGEKNVGVIITVSNNGKPMTRLDRKLSFADPATEEHWGQGLQFVQIFAMTMGGQISIHESSLRGGPKFIISLPHTEFRIGESDAVKQILIVDDNENSRRDVIGALEGQSFRCREAKTIDEAFQLLKTESFFGAILDVDLGEKRDGIWLLEYIRKKYPTIRVVVMSGSSLPGWEMRANLLGAHQCLEKQTWNDDDLVALFW